jgi:hypothetical protein
MVWAAAMQIEAFGIGSANLHPIVDAALAVGAEVSLTWCGRATRTNQVRNILALRTNTRLDFVFIPLRLGRRVRWLRHTAIRLGSRVSCRLANGSLAFRS